MGEPAGREHGLTPDRGHSFPGGPTVLRIRLGSHLRRLRMAKGISAEDAGDAIRASQSKISRMEMGRIGFKERDVEGLLTLYGLTDEAEREALLGMARQSNAPGWWHRYSDVIPEWYRSYISLEEAAVTVFGFESRRVPDFLQTPEYAAALGGPGQVNIEPVERERRAGFSARRRELLRNPAAPLLWFVIDEGVLLRRVGGRDVMRSQLEHLIEVSAHPQVRVQILPLTAPLGAGGRFSILRFAEPTLPDVVFIEHLNSALYLDRRADVDVYRDEFNRLAVAALDSAETRRVIRAAIATSRSPRAAGG